MLTKKQINQQRYDASPKGRARAARYHKTSASKAYRAKLARTETGLTASTARARRKRERYHQLVYNHYGRVCSICDFDDMRALSIDHVNQQGIKHVRPNGKRYAGGHLRAWLVANKFPSGFRTLCMNCQAIEFHKHRSNQECRQ